MITKDEFKLIEAISDKFLENVLEKKGDARKEFDRVAMRHPLKALKLKKARDRYKTLKGYSYMEDEARALTAFCEAALPIFYKAFGQDFTVAALPEEARSEKAAALCERLGGQQLAALCRLGIQP